MRIQHNIMAMNAYRNYNSNVSAMKSNLEKLSSGYKINRAGDDAAGLAISEKMRAQITGLNAAQKNVKDGISLVQTAEGAMQEVQDMLNRMVYLATQSANGTYDNEVDRLNLQKELDQLSAEINRISDSANFNGIKLLDGSLAAEQVVDKIDVTGALTYKSVGSKATYETLQDMGPYGATASKAEDGDVLTFNIGFDDGTSTSIKLKVDTSEGAGKNKLTSLDGKTTYATLAADGVVADTEVVSAVVAALKETDLANEFAVSANGKKIKLEALEPGATGRVVRSFDMTVEGADGTKKAYAAAPAEADATKIKSLGVKATAGLNEGIEIKAADLTEYNGNNLEDALFTINGHKFVILANDMDPNKTTEDATKNTSYLRAVQGLGEDVTVLVGGIGGLMGGTPAGAPAVGGAADTANSNFAQNIKKIADVTGLNVTAGVDETTLNPAAGAATGAGATNGIRLSLSGKKVEGKGLTLQIGDTAESFNQLKVSIGDIHCDALGIDGIKISDQGGAQAAIAKIKNAINTVSSIRGDLGATQNRLEHTANNLSVMQENITDAESSIRDTDVAEEMMAYTKNNILIQSAQAMLAQANQIPQGVLQLLQ